MFNAVSVRDCFLAAIQFSAMSHIAPASFVMGNSAFCDLMLFDAVHYLLVLCSVGHFGSTMRLCSALSSSLSGSQVPISDVGWLSAILGSGSEISSLLRNGGAVRYCLVKLFFCGAASALQWCVDSK